MEDAQYQVSVSRRRRTEVQNTTARRRYKVARRANRTPQPVPKEGGWTLCVQEDREVPDESALEKCDQPAGFLGCDACM